MKIAITGASGLLGSALCRSLANDRHEIVRMVRRQETQEGEAFWLPAEGRIDADALEETDAVVHLAGENIAQGRWTKKKKARIRSSRVDATAFLSRTLANLASPPKLFISASAIGYYGDRGSDPLTEEAGPDEGFLPQVCADWEAATEPAVDAGIRTINARIGVVLSKHGGALKPMLRLFRWRLGGVVGPGDQYWAWISIHDVVGAMRFLLAADDIHGPVNLTAPEPATNREFTKTLASALSVSAFFPLPSFMAKLVMGEMAQWLLLASARVVPAKLEQAGYPFRHVDLESAIDTILNDDEP